MDNKDWLTFLFCICVGSTVGWLAAAAVSLVMGVGSVGTLAALAIPAILWVSYFAVKKIRHG